MITHSEYRITGGNESKNYCLSLPCFTGDEQDFDAARRMNHFYSHAADNLYLWTKSYFTMDAGRISFDVGYDVDTTETNLTVNIHIVLRCKDRGKKTITRKRLLSHTWSGGYILKRNVSTVSIV